VKAKILHILSKLFKTISILLLCFGIIILVCNIYINSSTEDKTFSNVEDIPHNKVGMVLGTSKYLINGNINLYFQYRINATIKLYQSGKIDYILVSGDNGSKYYNEPSDFKEELITKGIPEDKIYLDYAGFRTLDSVVRSKLIFGQMSITVISQKFHNQRAIFLAEHHDINAVGFNAKDVTGRYGIKTKIREYIARTKAVLDVLFDVEPKFYGEEVEIK
jgi:SanA protein